MIRNLLIFLLMCALVIVSPRTTRMDYSSIDPVKPTATPNDIKFKFDSLKDKHKNAFVTVIHRRSSSKGAGFIAKHNGSTYLITVAHVYSNPKDPLEIMLNNDSVMYHLPKVRPRVNMELDIAIIPLTSRNEKSIGAVPLELQHEKEMSVGDHLAAICMTNRFNMPLNVGRYAGTGKQLNAREYKHRLLGMRSYKNEFPYGCSGSAVISSQGQVVGMFNMTGTMRMRYLVRASDILKQLQK